MTTLCTFKADALSVDGGPHPLQGVKGTLIETYGGYTEAGTNCMVRLNITPEALLAIYKTPGSPHYWETATMETILDLYEGPSGEMQCEADSASHLTLL